MSIQAIAWVLEHSKATLADRLVLLSIANHADGKGWNAWPAVALIAAEAGVSERTVYRSVQTLELSGELRVVRRPGRPNVYGIPALNPRQIVRGDPCQIVSAPLTNCQKPVHRMSPEPYLTVNEPAREPASLELTPLPEDVRRRGAEFVRQLRESP